MNTMKFYSKWLIFAVITIQLLYSTSFSVVDLKVGKIATYKPKYKTESSLLSSRGNELFQTPLFSFGYIADIQYADVPDSLNFQGTKLRRYKNSKIIYEKALAEWSSLPRPVDFAIVLGDIIDGKAASKLNQKECLMDIMKSSMVLKKPTFFCFGNHCHYCFNRKYLKQNLVDPFISKMEDASYFPSNFESDHQLHFHWSPAQGWRFISLDAYDISSIGASSEANRELASTWLRLNNPNDLSIGGTWFNNLPKDKHRWVPYNGGIGINQLDWLEKVLKKSLLRNEKVVIFCHQPVFSPSKPNSLLWNAEDVLSRLWDSGNVVMWLAGHDHGGQSHVDQSGIVHLVPPAPIESEVGENSFGHVEVFPDGLKLYWHGQLPSGLAAPWPSQILF